MRSFFFQTTIVLFSVRCYFYVASVFEIIKKKNWLFTACQGKGAPNNNRYYGLRVPKFEAEVDTVQLERVLRKIWYFGKYQRV